MIRLYLITPPSGDPAPSVEAALAVLPRGSVGVQLRQPGRSAQDLLALARSLRAICTKAGAPLLINDRADVALAAGADGVHLPANGLPVSGARSLGLPLVGVSAHSPEEVARAARDGADFAVYAPVYETPGKTPRGEAALAEACRAAPIPVLALGGVNETNAHRCIDAGARGVACIRSVLGASDPAAAAIRLWQAITLALLLCASSASADDARYQDYPIGTRAMALGGAFVALSDDPSGLYYNPAGICDTRRLNVSVSASLYGLERQSTTGKISIGPGTFSIAGLAELNVIPGEAGMIKGAGKLDERGASWAYGFDVSVPSFRSSRTDASDPFEVHTRITDRTFTVAAGAAARFNEKLNLGFSVQYVLRLYETSEDALNVQGDPANPAVGVYHANASFQNGNLVTVVGAKYRLSDEWLLGASIGLPGAPRQRSRVAGAGHRQEQRRRQPDLGPCHGPDRRGVDPAATVDSVGPARRPSGRELRSLQRPARHRAALAPAGPHRAQAGARSQSRRRVSLQSELCARAGLLHLAQRRARLPAEPRRNAGLGLQPRAARESLRRHPDPRDVRRALALAPGRLGVVRIGRDGSAAGPHRDRGSDRISGRLRPTALPLRVPRLDLPLLRRAHLGQKLRAAQRAADVVLQEQPERPLGLSAGVLECPGVGWPS